MNNVSSIQYSGVENYNITANKKNENSSKSNTELNSFSTIQFTSKNDGKTYFAKKLTLTENGKEVTGVYVFPKDAKPDKDGNIQGEFMSYDTFKEKLASELPCVNSNTIKAYNGIKTPSPEEKFDRALKSGVKLSDGKILLRQIMMNTGNTEIKPSKNAGEYDVIFTSFVGGYKHEPSVKTLSEDELFADKGLSAGSIKPLEDGNYEVTYYIDSNFNNNDTNTAIMTKEECIEFLKSKHDIYI